MGEGPRSSGQSRQFVEGGRSRQMRVVQVGGIGGGGYWPGAGRRCLGEPRHSGCQRQVGVVRRGWGQLGRPKRGWDPGV